MTRAVSVVGQSTLNRANIDNDHFYLHDFLDRFPADLIGGPNEGSSAPRRALIEWGGSSPDATDIDGVKKIFRKRGWVRRLFKSAGAQAGDIVQVEETDPYAYRVRLLRPIGGA